MSVETNAVVHGEEQGHGAGDAAYRAWRINTNRLGLWLFLISDAFVFGGLLVARAVLWGDTRPELNQFLGLVVTTVLLVSSFFMNRAETAIAHDDMKEFTRSMLITLVLGTIFVIGVVFVEWPLAGQHFSPSDNVYGAVFYTMTGFHAFHVVTGLIFLATVLRKGRKGLYNRENHFGVEAAAVYWHFVDVAWIFFYPSLYLIGTLAH
jgi:cytochrome c oxidase subunit 3